MYIIMDVYVSAVEFMNGYYYGEAVANFDDFSHVC
jgi:hypothetical protein